MKKAKHKTVAVYGPDNKYMSQCRSDRANILIATERAIQLGDGSIKIKQTRQERRKMMKDIIDKADRKCYICGRTIPKDEIGSIDHIVPKRRSKYADVYRNMACCCKRCNEDKCNMLPTEYIEYICATREAHSYISEQQLVSLKTVLTLHQRSFYESLRKKGRK